jgi:beta-lactam-binding protein with PASTA domain
MRRAVVAVVLCAAFLAAAVPLSASARPDSRPAVAKASKVKVPKLRCRRLDVAEDILRSKGLRVRERGGGVFGIVVKSNWRVVTQSPSAGTRVPRGTRVTLYVDRDC